jgi:hypothetical protein
MNNKNFFRIFGTKYFDYKTVKALTIPVENICLQCLIGKDFFHQKALFFWW